MRQKTHAFLPVSSDAPWHWAACCCQARKARLRTAWAFDFSKRACTVVVVIRPGRYAANTRVIPVGFESPPAPDSPRKPPRTRLAVLVLYPLEVKRRLATVDTAKAVAVKLARQLIPARLHRTPDLDAFQCTAEVVEYDLRDLWAVRQTLEDGTNVWLSEVEGTTNDRPWWLW